MLIKILHFFFLQSCVCLEFPEPEATTATTTLAPTEPPTTLNPCTSPLSHYIGDSFCDPENNSAECLWDGGDCCPPHEHGSWKYYCEPTNVRIFFSDCNHTSSFTFLF